MVWWWLVVILAGCGRISFMDEHRGGVDGGSDSPVPPSDGSAAPCDLRATFGAPVPIAELDTTSDDAIMRLTNDELTTVFYRNDQLMIATRADRHDLFGAPTALASLNTAAIQEDPAITNDALGIVFRSQRNGGVGATDLYQATRASPAVAFDAATLMPTVNSTSGDVQPAFGPGGLYFASNRAGTYDLYVAPGSFAGGFGAPAEISELSGASDDEGPTLSADGLALYFASDRAPTAGGRDIWVAYRASTGVPFDPPTHVAELATAGTDSPTWLSPDGCRLYLTQHPVNGNADLYVANR